MICPAVCLVGKVVRVFQLWNTTNSTFRVSGDGEARADIHMRRMGVQPESVWKCYIQHWEQRRWLEKGTYLFLFHCFL